MGSKHDWSSVCSHLTPYRHTFFDYPVDSFEHTLLALNHFIKTPCHLIGYSLGGRIAMLFANAYPEKLLSLTIISSNPGIQERQTRLQNDQKWIQLIQTDGKQAFLKKWYQQPLFSSPKSYPKYREHVPTQKIIRTLQNLSPAKQPSMWNALTAWKIPTLFLFGKNDLKYQKISTRLASLNSNLHIRNIPDAGHALHLEQPAACAQHWETFYENTRMGRM